MTDLAYKDTEDILRRIGPLGEELVIIGGQALNFWAERYLARASDLAANAPYTSGDLDFCPANRTAVTLCAERLNGKAYLAPKTDTVNVGKVVYPGAHGAKETLDFLWAPYGLERDDVFRTSLPVEIVTEAGTIVIRIMHPVRVLESRVKNVIGLGSTTHGLKQLRASVFCAREFLRELLDEQHARAVLTLSERIFRFARSTLEAREVYDRHQVDPFQAIVTDPRLPSPFNDRRYPQMANILANDRRRRAADQARRKTDAARS